MKISVLALAAAAALASAGAFAQTKGEANYEEQCMRQAVKGSAAEQAAQRAKCVEEAKQAAKSGTAADDKPGTTATKAVAKSDRDAAAAKRKAAGAEVAKQPKQDPKNPTN